MLFTRIFDKRLAQASYLIGCQETGEALIIDPNRDVAQYIAAAAAERMRIVAVTETHIHADFVSGARELAAVTKAKLLLSGEGGQDWQYGFAAASGAQLLHHGDSFNIGRVRIDVLHTPGHTPEHLTFLLTDLPAGPHPLMAFTGDFVFVGDVGRPDLLEKAANQKGTMETSARALWRSLALFKALPDHVQVWPGHGAGSACGKALGAVPSSTVGYEKLVNWGLAAPSEEVFVRGVLEGQPEPPAYFAHSKRVNRDGPPLLGERAAPARISAAAMATQLASGAVLVDLRPADVFSRGHIKGAINVPLNQSFTTYGGSAIPFETPIVLVSRDETDASVREATREMSLIGLDDVRAYVTASDVEAVGQLDVNLRVPIADAIARVKSGTLLLDIRNSNEWAGGHAAEARLLPFPQLVARAGELPRNEPILIQCQSGSRSAIATSVLRRMGYDAADVGGIVAWHRGGGAVVVDPPGA